MVHPYIVYVNVQRRMRQRINYRSETKFLNDLNNATHLHADENDVYLLSLT
jgi:hypothetical protein